MVLKSTLVNYLFYQLNFYSLIKFDLLIFNKNDKYLSEEECGRITRIIQIVSDIDSAINEYNNSPCIDNLKAIIKSIRNTYNLG